MGRRTVETPWGELTLGAKNLLMGDTNGTEAIALPTEAGLAQACFFVDAEDKAVPERVRAVLHGGFFHAGQIDARPVGESSVVVDGETAGWRAQVQLDPLRGTIATGARVNVHVVDVAGRPFRKNVPAEQAVVRAVHAAFAALRESEPATVARIYEALMEGVIDAFGEAADKAEEQASDARMRLSQAKDLVREVADRHGSRGMRR